MILIIFFSLNGTYIGYIMGRTWETLSDLHEEFRERSVRDPYPLMAEKAGLAVGPKFAKFLRILTIGKIMLTFFQVLFISKNPVFAVTTSFMRSLDM